LIAVLRSIGGVAAGGIVTAVTYWIAIVIAFLAMHGIPLGSAGGPPTTGDLAVHHVAAAGASLGGGRVAARIARYRPHLHALAPGALLGSASFVGLSKPSSNWPDWFAYAMAAVCIGAAILAGRMAARR
jgi:hypothetical protein